MDFIALDVETANSSYRGSICQIALVRHANGQIETVYSSLVNPGVQFGRYNICVHGIQESDVADAPTIPEMIEAISPFLRNYTIVAHNAGFDIPNIGYAMRNYSMPLISVQYGCTYRAARMLLYNEISRFRLIDLCDYYNIEIAQHHDAEADAIACAKVAVKLCEDSNANSIEEMMWRAGHKLSSLAQSDLVPPPSQSTSRCKAQSHLFVIPDFKSEECASIEGKSVVITGELQSMFRPDAKAIIEKLGGTLADNVSKKTDILIVGMQDLSRTKGNEKSGKHRKAEKIIESGKKHIQIIDESEFIRLIGEG